jgi:hypothetical protein
MHISADSADSVGSADPADMSHTLHAFDAIDRGLACVTFSLHVAYPQAGCLPLPELRAPHDVDRLDTYAAGIDATLWLESGYWAPAWTRSLTSCTHGLKPYGVATAFDLIHAWRALVSRAADHGAQRHSTDAYSLDARLVLLAHAGNKLVAVSGGQHA